MPDAQELSKSYNFFLMQGTCRPDAHSHASGMFVVSEAEAAAIRAIFHKRGEFAAAVELRRMFPGITDTAQARECARMIAGGKPRPRRSRPASLRPN